MGERALSVIVISRVRSLAAGVRDSFAREHEHETRPRCSRKIVRDIMAKETMEMSERENRNIYVRYSG